MRCTSLITALSIPALISASCDNSGSKAGGRNCNWYGESPWCGSTSFNLGDWDDGQWLAIWTKDWSMLSLYNGGYITKDCRLAYGWDCTRGYKRLWCYEARSSTESDKANSTAYEEAKMKPVPFDQEVNGDQRNLRSPNSRFFIDAHGRERYVEVKEDREESL